MLDSSRNRLGCSVTLIILSVLLVLYVLIALKAEPGNVVDEDIQAVPVR